MNPGASQIETQHGEVSEVVATVASRVVIGAVLGYLYGRLIGCAGGSCPLTSNPLRSALWGAAVGFMSSFS